MSINFLLNKFYLKIIRKFKKKKIKFLERIKPYVKKIDLGPICLQQLYLSYIYITKKYEK